MQDGAPVPLLVPASQLEHPEVPSVLNVPLLHNEQPLDCDVEYVPPTQFEQVD